jgi:hypothetical protein
MRWAVGNMSSMPSLLAARPESVIRPRGDRRFKAIRAGRALDSDDKNEMVSRAFASLSSVGLGICHRVGVGER